MSMNAEFLKKKNEDNEAHNKGRIRGVVRHQ
jgi:hypothetical protein